MKQCVHADNMASKGDLSHAQVLLSSEYTLKRCLDLDKVVPVLLDQKSLPKSFRRKVKLAEKTKSVHVLIGAATELSRDGISSHRLKRLRHN